MKGRISLEGLSLGVHLGRTERERLFLSAVDVSVRLESELPDPPEAQLDYDAVCAALAPLSDGSFELIEDLARAILEKLRLLEAPGRWTVAVRKHTPPTSLGVRAAVFEVEE